MADTGHHRLRAARIAATIVTAEQAACAIQVRPSTYVSWEAGRNRAPIEVLSRLQWLYGVTGEYLAQGWIVSPSDELASRVERILFHDDRLFDPSATALRLRRVRSAVFATARAAAVANNWAVTTYTAHEAGTKPMSPERAIIYSIALRARPEHVVFGEAALFDNNRAHSERRSTVGLGVLGQFVLPLFRWAKAELSPYGAVPLVCPTPFLEHVPNPGEDLFGLVVVRPTDRELWLIGSVRRLIRGPDVLGGPNDMIVAGVRPKGRGWTTLGSRLATLSLHLDPWVLSSS